MDKIKQYSKFDRIFWGAGEIPTVPPSEYKSDGTWTNFDIAKGEIVLNVVDQKIWSRGDTGIYEISGSGGVTGATEQWVTDNFLSGDTVLTTTLSGLTDVTISGITEDDVIVWTGSDWINTGGTFVHITLPSSGDTFIYKDGLWVNSEAGATESWVTNNFLSGDTFIPTDFYSQSEVNDLFTQADSDYLSANTSYYTQTEVNNNFLSGDTILTTNLSGLTDVTISSPVVEQVLRYNGSIWVNSGITDAVGATELWVTTNFLSGDTFIPTDFYSQSEVDNNFLSANTSISGATEDWVTDNFLSANTSYYTQTEVNNNFLSGSSQLSTYLSGLTDVSFTGLTDTDVLVYDGTEWTNTAVTWVAVVDPLTGDTIVYQSGYWINQSSDVVNYITGLVYSLPDPIITTESVTLKKIDSGTTTVAPYFSETIDGSTGQTLQQWDAIKVKSDGTDWFII